MLFNRDYWKKEWTALERKERHYIKKQKEQKDSVIRQKISEKIPDKLESTLNAAFRKAFELVFEKGTGMIEKTYNKEKHEQSFQVNEYAAGIRKSRKSVKAFSRQAGASQARNLLISGVEGVGLGLLGVGIPDIPLFTAVILKSIYEIALSYGFSYETEEEQRFILKVIETAFLHGERLETADEELNRWIEAKVRQDAADNKKASDYAGDLDARRNSDDGMDSGNIDFSRKEQIARTSDILAEALLYMKFIQGIPVAGVVGGLADTVYLKRITDYADLKYRRRFLKKQIQRVHG